MKILPILNINNFKISNINNSLMKSELSTLTASDTYNGIAFTGKNKKKKKKKKVKTEPPVTIEEMLPQKKTKKGFMIPEKPSVDSLIANPFQRDILRGLYFASCTEEDQNKILDSLEDTGNKARLKQLVIAERTLGESYYLIDFAHDSIQKRFTEYAKADSNVLDVFVNNRNTYNGEIHLNGISSAELKFNLIDIVTKNYENDASKINFDVLSKMLLTKNNNGELPIQYIKTSLIFRGDENISYDDLINNAAGEDRQIIKSEKQKVLGIMTKEKFDLYNLQMYSDNDENLPIRKAVARTSMKIFDNNMNKVDEKLKLAFLDAALLNNDILITMLDELSETKTAVKFSPFVKNQIIEVAKIIDDDLAEKLDEKIQVTK